MKLLYIASVRLPTEKAHGIQIMKTCEAMAKIGTDVTLAVPDFIFSSSKENPFDYYGVKRVFKIKRFFSVRLVVLGPIGFFLETFIFFLSLVFSSDFWKADYIFSRDEMLVSFSSLLGKKTIWETHTGSYNLFAKSALKKSQVVVAISSGLRDFYISKGVSSSKIVISPDGVDLEDFNVSYSKNEARETLKLPPDKNIILYAGRLDGWKGAETLLQTSAYFNDGAVLCVVGGDQSQISLFSKKYPKVLFLGYKPYKELPVFQKAADVLVVPNTSKSIISKFFTSPLKVFSYMASGVPIVATDLPSIREVLNPQNSILVEPDSSLALFNGINLVLEDKNKAGIIAKQAFFDVSRYSWVERANRIISSIL